MLRKFLPWIFLIFLVLACEESTNRVDSRTRKIGNLITQLYDSGAFSGVILVADPEKVIYQNALGMQNKENGIALGPGSQFYLASVSKHFTTAALLILQERGRLDLDEALHTYFPDFPDYARGVTLRHMMTHTSGIPDHYQLGAYKPGLTNQDVYELLINQDTLDFEPGSKYKYSNGGYVLLSMVIEQVSGQPLRVFLEENVFQPAHMTSTLVYDTTAPVIPDRVKGYTPDGKEDDYELFTLGAGGLYSNVQDLRKWDRVLYTNSVLSEASKTEAFTPYILNNGDTSYYGLGWSLEFEWDSLIYVQHTGSLNGFRNAFRRYPGTEEVLILLTNNGNDDTRKRVMDEIDVILRDQPE